jgi:hypothetical protein
MYEVVILHSIEKAFYYFYDFVCISCVYVIRQKKGLTLNWQIVF